MAADGGPEGLAAQGRAPFADEEVLADRLHGVPLFPPRLDEPAFVPPQRRRDRSPPLEAGAVEDAAFDIH
jgi:hypothetical protein